MPAVDYATPIKVHPDRTGGNKNRANEIFVLHTSEGTEGDNSAEALASMMTRPGDRPSESRVGGFYGSSYQYVTDTGQRVIPCTPENVVSYSAPPANTYGIHICLPGRADQTRAQWLDGVSRQYIRAAAGVMVDRSGPLAIPLVRLTLAELKAHRRGYCDHDDIADAFGETDHYDVGPNFPWDVLANDITELSGNPTTPPKDDDMKALPKPLRAYDSRPGLPVDAPYDTANAGVIRAPLQPNQSRQIFVGLTSQVEVNVTAISNGGNGWVEVSGVPINAQPTTGLVGFDTIDRVEMNTGIVATPDGHVYVTCALAPCDVAIDVRAQA